MGLWIKNDDGSIEKVAGSGGGGGGTFDGEHVITGDPTDPAMFDEVAVGQLLYDGVEGTGGGPHDHTEYALVEHDHDEFVHDHDYLPLAGGTLDSGAQIRAKGTAAAPAYSFAAAPDVGLYLANGVDRIAGFQGQLWTYGRLVANDDVVVNRTKLWLEGGKTPSSIYNYDGDATRTVLRLVAGGDHVSQGAMLSLYGGDDASSPHVVRFHTNNKTTFELNADQSAKVFGDLQVDGNLTVKSGGSATNAAIGFNGIDGMGIYSSAANNYMRFGVAGAQRMAIKEGVVVVNTDLQVDGQIRGPQGTQLEPTYSSVNDPSSGFYAGNFGSNKSAAISVDGVYRVHVAAATTRIRNDLQVDGTISGTLAFGIAEDIDTAEVLERAETATMPVLDDEGVATTDAEVESITINEVVTALLAKVKQLSAEIEELKGA